MTSALIRAGPYAPELVSDKEKGLPERQPLLPPGMSKFTWNLSSTHVGIVARLVNFVKS